MAVAPLIPVKSRPNNLPHESDRTSIFVFCHLCSRIQHPRNDRDPIWMSDQLFRSEVPAGTAFGIRSLIRLDVAGGVRRIGGSPGGPEARGDGHRAVDRYRYEQNYNFVRCLGSLCELFPEDSRTVRAIHNFTPGPDGKARGTVTGYCVNADGDPRCPDWVKDSVLPPIG